MTHSLWFLPQVDEIYVIEEGCIKEHGSFADLMSRGGSLVELMKVYNAANEAAAKEKDSETGISSALIGTTFSVSVHCTYLRL